MPVHALNVGVIVALLRDVAGFIAHSGADHAPANQTGACTHGSAWTSAKCRTCGRTHRSSDCSRSDTGLRGAFGGRASSCLTPCKLTANRIILIEGCEILVASRKDEDTGSCRHTGAPSQKTGRKNAGFKNRIHGSKYSFSD